MGFLEFLRGVVTEDSVNTFKDVEIPTPASRTESLAMLIHQMKLQVDLPAVEDGQSNSVNVVVSSSDESAIIGVENTHRLMGAGINVQAGLVEGTLSEYIRYTQPFEVWEHFHPPILYPRRSIFLGVEGVGNAAVSTARLMIGYELAKVDAGDFIAALVD